MEQGYRARAWDKGKGRGNSMGKHVCSQYNAATLLSKWRRPGMPGFTSKLARLAPNETNPGLFQIKIIRLTYSVIVYCPFLG